MENTYKMTDRDTTLMIQLRATNAAIFTGRRNSAMRGWRAIRREMGFQGSTLTAQQLKKKWENLKDKYRALKNPPLGMESTTQPSSWRWFHLMDDAFSGRLAGSAAVVQPSPLDEEEDEDDERSAAVPPLIHPSTGAAFSGLSGVETGTLEAGGMLGEVLELCGVKACGNVEAASRTEPPAEVVPAGGDGDQVRSPECEPTVMESQPVINDSQTATLYVTLLPDCTSDTNKTPSSCEHSGGEDAEVELQREWQALEREQAELDRELVALERDREMLSRDRTAVERDRASVERDRTAVERDRVGLDRDRALLDRDRAFLDRDRAFLERDRVFLERAREDLERERALWRRDRAVLEREGAAGDGRQAEMRTEKEVVLQTRLFQSLVAADLDPDQLETRQRLVSLFQRLVEKL